MREVGPVPCRKHVLVCTNAREPGGLPSCGEVGEAIFARLKARQTGEGLARSYWVTRTGCLGYCHAAGATVAIYRPKDPGRPPIFLQAVTEADVDDPRLDPRTA